MHLTLVREEETKTRERQYPGCQVKKVFQEKNNPLCQMLQIDKKSQGFWKLPFGFSNMEALVTLTIVVLGELRGKILIGEDSKEKRKFYM